MAKPVRRRRPSYCSPTAGTARNLTQQAQQGVRTTALRKRDYLFGSLGVSTLGVLAASSLIPLMGAGTDPVVATWLAGLGSNALASWLTTWAEGAGAKVIRQQCPAPEDQIAALAQALDEQMAIDIVLADDVATLLTKIDAIPTVLDAQTKQLDAQTDLLLVHHDFLQQLHTDLQQHGQQQHQLQQVVITSTEHLLTTHQQQIDRLDAGQQAILARIDMLYHVMLQQQDMFRMLASLQQLLQRATPPYRAAVQPMLEHYTAIFGGRAAELAHLDAWLEADTHPYAFLYAPTGCGKTALLIHWVAHLQQRGECVVIFIPISRRYQMATEACVLNVLATALADIHGEQAQLQQYDQTPDQRRLLIIDYLRRPLPPDQRVVLVLDGLDEAIGWQVGRWFPTAPPPGLHIIAAARQVAHTTRIDWYDRLGWPPRLVHDLELAGLNTRAVQEILHRLGTPLDQVVTDDTLLDELMRISDGDPLTIRFMIEALREKEKEIELDHLKTLPTGLRAFVQEWLEDILEKSDHSERVYALLALCAVALGPLTGADLQALDPIHLGRGVQYQKAAREVHRFVIGDGSAAHGYVLSHPRLRELFLEEDIPILTRDEQKDFQQRFVDYGRRWYATPTQPLADYLRLFWMTHLAEHEEWDLMQRVLTDIEVRDEQYHQRWAAAHYRAEGSYTGYLDDLARLWDYADAQQQIVLGLRCALITASIHSLSGNLTPELLVGLVTVGTPAGTWSSAAALEHVRHVTNEHQQVAMLTALLDADCLHDYDTVLGIVHPMRDDSQKCALYGALLPHLSAEEQTEVYVLALTAATAIKDEDRRARVLTGLAPHLPVEEQTEVYALALTAATAITPDPIRVAALRELAPHLPAALLPEALTAATAIRNEGDRARALRELAPHLPVEEQTEVYTLALTAATAIRNEGELARALTGLAPHLPVEEQTEVYALALTAATAIRNEGDRARVLTGLAPHLPVEEQTEVYTLALTAATAIRNEGDRAAALRELAPRLAQHLDGSHWSPTIRTLATYGRAGFLSSLTALTPWLVTLTTPAERSAIAQAISEVSRCWP